MDTRELLLKLINEKMAFFNKKIEEETKYLNENIGYACASDSNYKIVMYKQILKEYCNLEDYLVDNKLI